MTRVRPCISGFQVRFSMHDQIWISLDNHENSFHPNECTTHRSVLKSAMFMVKVWFGLGN